MVDVAQRVPLGGAHQLGRRVVERRRGAVEGLGVERLGARLGPVLGALLRRPLLLLVLVAGHAAARG